MNDFVLDCSAALAWVFADEVTPATESLMDDLVKGAHAWVPAVWPLEIANVMLGAQRRGRIDKAGVEKYLATLKTLDIEIDDETGSLAWNKILGLGERYNLTSYDAAYLELALRKGLPLASLDQLLRAACTRAGGRLVL
ncbi:type II toxin-antitoxin system VapC family toxin [Horticoccus luteus]|uniref:Type II toxin-antitoxin system VapC family toxin n=1 Tax=Horticoccus luteus TaxID=2862869 RepID=A0A8F9TWN3_9BACT|nr:type II toxin-antitoxin system VapC family toxin [Horticoccus luteus]QYM79128.1 type II toxin-antitoxin system VapC family toxin [Horticoccus luteus]